MYKCMTSCLLCKHDSVSRIILIICSLLFICTIVLAALLFYYGPKRVPTRMQIQKYHEQCEPKLKQPVRTYKGQRYV